jgi:hypothetical protein
LDGISSRSVLAVRERGRSRRYRGTGRTVFGRERFEELIEEVSIASRSEISDRFES